VCVLSRAKPEEKMEGQMAFLHFPTCDIWNFLWGYIISRETTLWTTWRLLYLSHNFRLGPFDPLFMNFRFLCQFHVQEQVKKRLGIEFLNKSFLFC